MFFVAGNPLPPSAQPLPRSDSIDYFASASSQQAQEGSDDVLGVVRRCHLPGFSLGPCATEAVAQWVLKEDNFTHLELLDNPIGRKGVVFCFMMTTPFERCSSWAVMGNHRCRSHWACSFQEFYFDLRRPAEHCTQRAWIRSHFRGVAVQSKRQEAEYGDQWSQRKNDDECHCKQGKSNPPMVSSRNRLVTFPMYVPIHSKQMLRRVLSTHPALTHLELGGVAFMPQAMERLPAAFRQAPLLMHLNLSGMYARFVSPTWNGTLSVYRR